MNQVDDKSDIVSCNYGHLDIVYLSNSLKWKRAGTKLAKVSDQSKAN